MNSVAPSRARAALASARAPARAASSTGGSRRRGSSATRRARAVGRQLERPARRRAARASRRAGARAPRPSASAAARARSRRTGPAARGSGEGAALREGRVERPPARASARPSTSRRLTMWCMVSSSRCSPAQSRSSAPAAAARARGRTAGAPRRGEPPASASRGPLGQRAEVDHRQRQPAAPAAITCTGRPPRTAKMVRSASWRRTTRESAARAADVEAAASGATATRRCCRPRCPGRAGRGTRAAPGRRRAAASPRSQRGMRRLPRHLLATSSASGSVLGASPPVASCTLSAPPGPELVQRSAALATRLDPQQDARDVSLPASALATSTAAASPATVGASNSGARQLDPKGRDARRAGWRAASGRRGRRSRRRPPPARARAARPDAASTSSTGVRGGAHGSRSRRSPPAPARAGAWRSTLPLGVSGSAASGTKPTAPCSRAACPQEVAQVSGRRRPRVRGADVGHQPQVLARPGLAPSTTTASRTPGWPASAASTSPGSMRKPRTLTWWSRRPRNSSSPSGAQRARSPVR